MTRGQQIIEKIKTVFADVRKKYPQITDNDLDSQGAIFYMNGNDGTDFDWNANKNTSEFYMYHKNEIGFIKLYVNKGDTYTAYVYPNGEMSATEIIKGDLDTGDSLYLAALLYRKADRKYIYDKPIENIDFSYEPTMWEMKEMDGYIYCGDDDDYYYDDDEDDCCYGGED